MSAAESAQTGPRHRMHEYVPTATLRRFLDHSTVDRRWWEIREKDLRTQLKAAERMQRTRAEEIARIEEELQYRQDHPEAER